MLSMHLPCAALPLDALLDTLTADALMADATAHGSRLSFNQPKLTTDGSSYEVTVPAPGVAPSDFALSVENHRLLLKGETITPTHTHFLNYTVALPDDADAITATATACDGVLTVSLQKKAEAVPTRVPIEASVDAETTETETAESTEPVLRPYKITLVKPGLAAADIEVLSKPGLLKVEGATKRTGASVSKVYQVPRDGAVDEATASAVDGVLTIVVPKRKTEPVRIPVNAPSEEPPAATDATEMTVAAVLAKEAELAEAEAAEESAEEEEMMLADTPEDAEEGVMV